MKFKLLQTLFIIVGTYFLLSFNSAYTCEVVTISATPGVIPANGTTASTIEVSVTDIETGDPKAGVYVYFRNYYCGTLSSYCAITDSAGRATVFFTSLRACYSDISATTAGSNSDWLSVGCYKVEADNINATDPENTIVNYHLEPSDIVITSANFNAPGESETKSNLSGNFYFTFDQNDLDWDYEGNVTPQIIQLICNVGATSQTVTINATRVRKVTTQAQEVIYAFFLGQGLGNRIYTHKLQEIYHKISYSIPYSGKTVWVGVSMAALYVNGDYRESPYDNGIGDADWAELHKYIYSGGSTTAIGMNIAIGLGVPSTLYKDCSSNCWFEENNLKGIATTTALLYYYEGGVIPAATIQNAEIDCNIYY
ncbi:MAG: hypothetical protein DRP78_05220 [Candidatus Omnitrophota bacterium]|nr:MAG: hypothetical protein DRP78_05220 [Candidatus Omnitrophota bacterium]